VHEHPVLPPDDQVRAFADRLNAAGTVTLFCGAGVRGAHREVMRLAARLNSPVGHSLGGKEWIQHDNPFDVGLSGPLGYGACYQASHEADLLVLLGTDFPHDAFLPQARTIQVNRDPARLGRRSRLELAVHGDMAATLRAALPMVVQKTDRSFLDRMLDRHANALERSVGPYPGDIERCLCRPSPRRLPAGLTGLPPATPCSLWIPACVPSGPPARKDLGQVPPA
jgi:pyruvate dehydrogenase (quinone)